MLHIGGDLCRNQCGAMEPNYRHIFTRMLQVFNGWRRYYKIDVAAEASGLDSSVSDLLGAWIKGFCHNRQPITHEVMDRLVVEVNKGGGCID